MPELGAKRSFINPEDLKIAFDKYFKKTKEEELTLSGLALIFGSKQSMSNYLTKDKYKEYHKFVREAKLKVENSYEKTLRKYGKSGDIFALKNMGWTDRQELTGKGGKPIPFMIVDYKPVKESKDNGSSKDKENDPV